MPLWTISGVWMSAVAQASCPWVCIRLSDMGKMPMPLEAPTIRRCASVLLPRKRNFASPGGPVIFHKTAE
jgi:hypothetical protein